jgi:hypothetical protein
MTDFTAVDYFSDESVAVDAYPYFGFLLDGRRVWREPHHGVVMVAGHEEVVAVLRDTATFSNINIVAGPDFRFPAELTGGHRAPARSHERHPRVARRAWPGRRAPLRLPSDLHDQRAKQAQPRIRLEKSPGPPPPERGRPARPAPSRRGSGVSGLFEQCEAG